MIAIKEAEHRPLIGKRFPHWVNRVEYWHIHDIDQAEMPPGIEFAYDGLKVNIP